MNYFLIPTALIVALLLIFVLSLVLRRPLKGFGYIFLILFLATWVGQIWIAPVGPVVLGIAWVPLGFISLLLFFFVLAFSSAGTDKRKEKQEDAANEAPLIIAGFFFWFLVIILLLAIGVGFFRHPAIIA